MGDQETETRKTVNAATTVKPERTDVLQHRSESRERDRTASHGTQKLQRRHRRKEDALIFGLVSRQTMSLIMLVIVAVVGFTAGVKEISVSIPIFCVIIVIEFIMGFMLGSSPAFVSIFICAALMIVGAFSGMFIAVCIGNVVMLSTVQMVKGI